MKLSRRFIAIVTLLAALLALAVPALAGGFAVVTLDELPGRVVAGEPLTLGFMVRQHGHTPMSGLTPSVIATRPDTREEINVPARPEGEAGHYVATVTFPSAGTWEWIINDGFVTADALGFRGQPMPALSVLTSTGAAVSSPSPAPPLSLAPLVIALGVAGAGAGLIAVVRTRASWAAALTLASLMLVVLGFMASGSTATASTVPQSASRPPEVEHGQALFLAKGCVICHAHASVSEARRTFGDWRIGPDLSKLSAKPEYLQAWLKDPRAVKPATEMPDLKLKPAEIDALAAFLTQGQ